MCLVLPTAMFTRAPLWPQFLHPLKTTLIGPGFVPDSYKRIWVLMSPFFLLPRSLSLSEPRHQECRAWGTWTLPGELRIRVLIYEMWLLATDPSCLAEYGPKSSSSVHKAHLPIRFPARDPSQHTQAVGSRGYDRVQAQRFHSLVAHPASHSGQALDSKPGDPLTLGRRWGRVGGGRGLPFPLVFPFGK